MGTRGWLGCSAVTVVVLVTAAGASSQGASSDAWQMVPAPPTTCFPDDGFDEKLSAASEAINAAIERQTKVNAELKERFDNMDMSEKAQRMQAFMMRDPQAAMKMLQAEQAYAATATSGVTEANEATPRLDAELARDQASVRKASDQAVAPVRARQQQLIAAKTVAVGEAAEPMFTAAADHAQYVRLVEEENAAYEKACAPYFGGGGTFHRWLASYRAEVIDKLIAAEEGGDAALVGQMAIMDTPTGGYRSTASLRFAGQYLDTLRKVYSVRRAKATPRVGLKQ